MSGGAHMRAAALLAVVVAVTGCQWMFGLDRLGDKKCPPGQKPCEGEGECVSITNYDKGCGRESCAPCSFTHGKARCDENFECVRFACQPGYEDCDDDYDTCETDLNHDEKNCGRCNNPCVAKMNAYAACSGGECTSGGCLSGWGECDNNPDTGCETPVGDAGTCPPPDAGQ